MKLFTLIIIYLRSVSSDARTGVTLGSSSNFSLYSYVDTGYPILPNMTQVSVCLRFRVAQANHRPFIFSYFANNYDNEMAFSINGDHKSFLLQCCSGNVWLKLGSSKIPLFKWTSFCLVIDLQAKIISFAVDDQPHVEHHSVEAAVDLIYGNGRLVLGQDLDTMEGDFSDLQSFTGDIVDFYLTNTTVPDDQILHYLSNVSYTWNAPGWLSFQKNISFFKLIGNTYTFNFTEHIFNDTSHLEVLLPQKVDCLTAFKYCNILKGSVITPLNEKHNIYIYDTYIRFRNECLGTWSTTYWIGMRGNASINEFVNVPSFESITSEQKALFYTGYDTPTYDCVSSGSKRSSFPYWLFATDLTDKACTLCQFSNPPSFKMRGLCDTSVIDKQWFIHGYANGFPIILGEYYGKIYWNSTQWIMTNRRYKVNGYMQSTKKIHFPWGLRQWYLNNDDCFVSEPRVNLVLSACNPNEMTCHNNGECISKDHRCDGITDCQDNSDEQQCDFVQVTKEYSANQVPKTIRNSTANFVGVHLLIASIRNFNLVGFRVKIDVLLSVTWKDERITFKNLYTDFTKNELTQHETIWVPALILEDGNQSPLEIKTRSSKINAVRGGQPPIPDNLAVLFEDILYNGSSVSLIYSTKMTCTISCQFDLKLYPFDKQECSLTLQLSASAQDVALKQVENGVVFSGTRNLLEYELVEETMHLEIINGKYIQKVTLIFKNQFGYYLGNAVLPSILLLCICYSVYMYDLEDFTDRVMISLTSLLVLTSLFSQTSESIPKTSYLKLIDVWYIVLIVYDFLIIMTVVWIEYLRLTDKQTNKISIAFKQQTLYNAPINQALKVNKYAKITFPVIFIAFLIYFGTYATISITS